MNKLDQKVLGILVLWIFINIIQALFTPMANDEVYYWLFSERPDWGYFNHPPFVGWIIWISRWILSNELAIRFPAILLNALGIWLIYKTIQPKQITIFLLVIFGMIITHVLAFVSTPDVPLFFFTCLFFYLLKKYLDHDQILLAVLLGLTIALMGYAKYQGILVVVFSFIPLYKLIRRPSFWLILLTATMAFLPHLLWQYHHEFATFRFHLSERSPVRWKWNFPLDYLLGQLLIFGPLISILLFLAERRNKKRNAFNQALQWTLWGSLVFFFIMSFKGRTEANWTSFLVFPLVYLAHESLIANIKMKSWVIRLGIFSLALLTLTRFLLLGDWSDSMGIKLPFESKETWALDLAEAASELPVVFYSSYQPVSNYIFHTRNEAFLISMDRNSGSQHLFWVDEELSLQGKQVFNLCNDWVYCTDSVTLDGQKHAFRIIDNWRSYNYLKIKAINPVHQLKADSISELKIILTNRLDQIIKLEGSKNEPLNIVATCFETNDPMTRMRKEVDTSELKPGQSVEIKSYVKAPSAPGKYRYTFSLEVPGIHQGKNCRFYSLNVE